MLIIGKPYVNSLNSLNLALKKAHSLYPYNIYGEKRTVDYFTSNGANTVNMCAINISKAFDQLNQNKLFTQRK